MGESEYASRSGLKLAAAIEAFGVEVSGLVCADLGSHAGGFVDCLLGNGAARVYSVDTGYGVLAYRLRKDPRVVVCERQNALYYQCPELCDLITIDVGWTPQRLILPAARRSLKDDGRVITLVKPHYEAPRGPTGRAAARKWLSRGVLRPEHIEEVLATCHDEMTRLGWRIEGEIESPLKGHGGNVEFLLLLAPDLDAVQAPRPPTGTTDRAESTHTSGGMPDQNPERK